MCNKLSAFSLTNIITAFKFYFSTFTYNMHAFGLSRDLCSEFLRKQCVIANLSKGKVSIEVIVIDNEKF